MVIPYEQLLMSSGSEGQGEKDSQHNGAMWDGNKRHCHSASVSDKTMPQQLEMALLMSHFLPFSAMTGSSGVNDLRLYFCRMHSISSMPSLDAAWSACLGHMDRQAEMTSPPFSPPVMSLMCEANISRAMVPSRALHHCAMTVQLACKCQEIG